MPRNLKLVCALVATSTLGMSQTPTTQQSPAGPPRWSHEAKEQADPPQNNVPNGVELAREHKFHRNFVTPLDAQGAPSIGSRTYVTHSRVEAIPTDSSDTILIATPTQNQPYFAEGHSSVFTDLSLSVDRYIFRTPSVPDSTSVSILYSGGAIKNSRGEISRTELASGSTPLQLGRKYLLFLKHDEDTQSYEILRAWDLSANKPILLDQNGAVSQMNAKLNVPTEKDLEAQVASKITPTTSR